MHTEDKRIALVTGANKGIGFEIARQLCQAGVTVLLGTRDSARGDAAAGALRSDGLDAHSIRLDVTQSGSVEAAAASISTEHGCLDILVNNAGIAGARSGDGPPGRASLSTARQVFETNFLGALSVTQSMLPLLRRSPAGRIVNLSSSLGSLALNGDPASEYYAVRFVGYSASKAALNMLTVQLAQELRNTPILVNSVCPGYVKTDLNDHSGNLTPAQAAATPVRLALRRGELTSGCFFNAQGTVPW